MNILVGILQIVGSLGVFLFGMKVMGDGLQNSAGSRLQKMLGYMTSNRFTAFATGIIFTGIIQSSSATTVIVVSFVNAGLLSLTQAIGVILGANIGTTATAWIVSFFGFKFSIASLALPAIAIGLPFMFMKSSQRRSFGDIFIGFGILFLGLMFLKDSVPNVRDYPEILQSIASLSHYGFASTILFVFVGTVFTIIVQSSSAAMAITVTMANAGWIDFPTAAALVLGENIGTTITAQIASFGQHPNSRRAAMAHTMFNVIGVTWMLAVFPIFLTIVDSIIPGSLNDPHALPLHLSMFHTAFNLLNAFLFIGFVPVYAQFIERLLPKRADEQETNYKLKYLSASLQDTPEMHYLTVRTEVEKMAHKVLDLFHKFSNEISKLKEKNKSYKFDPSIIFKGEHYLDQMQEEIASYIASCMQERPSEASARNLGNLIKTVDDFETISDSVARLAAIFARSQDKHITFPKAHIEAMEPFLAEVGNGLSFVVSHAGSNLSEESYQTVAVIENKIDQYRNDLKKSARKRIEAGSDVKMEILFIDMLEELEKIGDYILEIAKELRNMKV